MANKKKSEYSISKKQRPDGKRTIRVSKKAQEDFLVKLKEKLEDIHIKKYTFIVKGSKMHTAGIFWSAKNNKKFVFRSAYEFAYFYQLENNDNVISYEVEPFEIPYIDLRTKSKRIYIPDVMVEYKNGTKTLIEIKPKNKLKANDVRSKAIGAREYLADKMPNIEYRFVTEEEIFNSPSDYVKLLGVIDPEKQQKRLEKKERKREEKEQAEINYFKSLLPFRYRNINCSVV